MTLGQPLSIELVARFVDRDHPRDGMFEPIETPGQLNTVDDRSTDRLDTPGMAPHPAAEMLLAFAEVRVIALAEVDNGIGVVGRFDRQAVSGCRAAHGSESVRIIDAVQTDHVERDGTGEGIEE